VLLVAAALVTLTGCGYSGSAIAITSPIALGGSVHGGRQPVSGSRIQLYTTGISGTGSAAQPLLSSPVQSDSNGMFSIPATYRCPSASAQVYVVARGGNPGLSSDTSNSALALTAMLGPCSSLSAVPISVNEVTTVGSVWPLAHYMTAPTDFGSAPDDTAFLSAVSSVPEFVNLAQGSSPGTATATSYFAQNSKLYSLADVLADCVSSSGGSAGDGSPCGLLFSIATPPGGSAPTDTMTAAIHIAQNPDNNVTGIFGLVAGDTPFQPALTAAPADWTLTLSTPVATPSISLRTGTYVGTQQVTLSDSTVGSTIYYTTDGTVPRSSSASYAGAISIAVSSTVQAIAVRNESQSAAASSTLTITSAHPPAKLTFSRQPTNALTRATISPAVQVAVQDASGNTVTSATNPVTLALKGGTGLGGTLTVTPKNGVATFSNLTVGTAGSGYTLLATSPRLTSATSTSFTISAPSTASSPVKLAFSQQPTNALTQNAITPAVQVAVENASGITVTSATNPITLALKGGTGLGGTLTVTPQNGVATFSNLTVSTAGSGYTLSATSPNLTSATSTSFTISAPSTASSPAKLAFSQQPTNALTQAAITPAVQVVVENASGNTVASATNPITLALIGGSGLGGTLTATPQNGVATFSNLTVSNAGTYTLSATSPNLTSATSTNFTISAPSTATNGTTVLQSTPLSISATPGGTFEITYNWQAVPVSGPYSVFVDFLDSTGTVRFQDNVQPPTSPSVWTGTVSYTHTVTVPSTASMGTYKMVVGLQSTSGNLSLVAGPGVTSVGSGEYQTGTLTLAPTCSIAAFGAVGDGVTDNATAIQNTFNYAATNNCIALIPAGTFAYSGNITATGIAVAGTGAASILAPLSLTNESLTVSGSGGSVSKLVMVSTATTRLTTPWSGMIWINNATNYYVENVLINNSSSIGIMSYNSYNGYILNNTIENTLADSITQTEGSYNIAVIGNRILNSGDDGVSNNSYVGGPLVHDITVQGNTVVNNLWGRGIEVSGGSNIIFSGNYIDNTDGYADVYIASENQWGTQGIANVTVSGNTLVDGGPNQGSLIVYNSQGSTYNITGVTVSGNQFVNPKFAAVQFTGNGSETGILIENNTDYSTNQFSESGNGLATSTQTGDQVLAPSAYTTPLVSAGGGCNFSGC
jgi:Chitobiase/beta-hexosaminidase C-terminal domain/Right handed beta helix region